MNSSSLFFGKETAVKYIYLIRTDRIIDRAGACRTLYGIDVWRLPDRDARLHCSFPALFSSQKSAEALAQRLTEDEPAPEALSGIIEAAREDCGGEELPPKS